MARNHPFFERLGFTTLSEVSFDDCVLVDDGKLKCVFFWGLDCPNCEIAKNALQNRAEEVRSLGLEWFDVNVYETPDLGTRFGLFGIPVFLLFRNGKKLGRITPFPGFDDFRDAVQRLN